MHLAPQIIVSLILGGSVFLLVWAMLRYPADNQLPVHRRFAMAVGGDDRQTLYENATLAPLMSMLLQLSSRLQIGSVRNLIRRDLDAAGNPNGYSIEEYMALCLLCSLSTAGATLVLVLLLTGGLGIFSAIAAAAAGFAIPLWTLRQAATARAHRISRQLPYTLDLIALMMAAGSTFTEAIQAISSDDPEDDFNQELRIVLAEIEFGAKRADALTNLAERIPLETLRSVVGAANQAEYLGTPLSEILKNQAGMLRMHRSVRAEKLAASASLRILVPSMLILLAVVLFVFGPIVIRWSHGGLM